ncbi:MFS transporter [Niabella drilacis]|uniref:Sugar phosphate permease n=1 Tax=Niabella drilacis (strain DSM 25811 / CCM 8410 / CCUG 62505 / LMG 26954 / E90) TaxID=1285928 RepID=A0A1G6S5B3_NIADE|nr:MFS transporter [Niabella drilacis]SDD11365.1 Sugar phosphate permease [Niabella drilacis]
MERSGKTMARAWMVVGLLFIIAMLNYIDRTMITTMRSSIVNAIPMTDAEFGLLTAAFLWVYGLFSPLAGFLADRFSRSKVILVSLLIWSLVTWMTSYATSFQGLLVTRALMGLSEACYIPAALALIMDYHKGSTRSLATGIHMAGIMAGQSLGFLGGWIAENHQWNTAFFSFGIFGMVYAVLLLFVLKDAPREQMGDKEKRNPVTGFPATLKLLFRKRSYILLLIFFALVSLMAWLVVGWLPTYFQEKFLLSQTRAGIYSTGYVFTAAIFGVLAGGVLADQWSKVNKRARIWVPAIGLCVAAPAIFLASYTSLLFVAVGCFVVYAFTKSFTDTNTMPILSMIVGTEYRATGYGILNFCGTLIGGIALYFGGALRDAHISLSVIYQSAAFLIVLAALALMGIRTKA